MFRRTFANKQQVFLVAVVGRTLVAGLSLRQLFAMGLVARVVVRLLVQPDADVVRLRRGAVGAVFLRPLVPLVVKVQFVNPLSAVNVKRAMVAAFLRLPILVLRVRLVARQPNAVYRALVPNNVVVIVRPSLGLTRQKRLYRVALFVLVVLRLPQLTGQVQKSDGLSPSPLTFG